MLKTQGLTPVTREQGMAVAQKMNAQYMECSSKEMRGVEEIFERAILTVVANDRKTLEAQAASGGGGRSGGSRGGTSAGGSGGGAANGVTYTSGADGVPVLGIPKRKKRKCTSDLQKKTRVSMRPLCDG